MADQEKMEEIPPFTLEELPSDEQLFHQIASGEISLDEYMAYMIKIREEERGTDPLIEGVWGVSRFERRLREYLTKGVSGVLLAVDVDDFKIFNDTQGHPAGDELLKLTAKILQEQARTHEPTPSQQERRQTRFPQLDLVARAGDEFLIFMVGAGAEDGVLAALRMRKAIAKEARQQFPNFPGEQTISLGVTLPVPGDDVKSLRYRADLALYQAKKGKGSKDPNKSVVISGTT